MRGSISVVIPTLDRPDSLRRALRSLAEQTRPPEEVIVVDSSEEVSTGLDMPLPCVVLRTPPGLCRQRNIGVSAARGSYVLLCDDDVELPPDYLRRLANYLDEDPTEGAVTGVVREHSETGALAPGFPTPSFRYLLVAFLFQLTVWGDVEAVRAPRGMASILQRMQAWYRRRRNTWSLAGWPLVTQVRDPVLHTAIYALGAALVRREWLASSPFDERLGPRGIGDNYGVSIGFPRCPGVAVLTDVDVVHHRAPEGRPPDPQAYFERILALHYFMRQSTRFSRMSPYFLLWSLLGSSVLFLSRGELPRLRRALLAALLIAVRRNPIGRESGGAAGSALRPR